MRALNASEMEAVAGGSTFVMMAEVEQPDGSYILETGSDSPDNDIAIGVNAMPGGDTYDSSQLAEALGSDGYCAVQIGNDSYLYFDGKINAATPSEWASCAGAAIATGASGGAAFVGGALAVIGTCGPVAQTYNNFMNYLNGHEPMSVRVKQAGLIGAGL